MPNNTTLHSNRSVKPSSQTGRKSCSDRNKGCGQLSAHHDDYCSIYLEHVFVFPDPLLAFGCVSFHLHCPRDSGTTRAARGRVLPAQGPAFPLTAEPPKHPRFQSSSVPYQHYTWKENKLNICNKGASSRGTRSGLLSESCMSQGQRAVSGQKQQPVSQLAGEGKAKMHTLLFSCWSSIWISVSLALSSSLAACKAAKASGFSPLARLLVPLLDMVRLRQGGESRPEALVPALALGFSSFPLSHYIFLHAWKEGKHRTVVRELEVDR